MRELIPTFEDYNVAIVEEYRNQHVASWEECVSTAITLRQQKDDMQWFLGMVTLLVEKFYMTKREDESKRLPFVYKIFAYEIGLDPTTLRRYKSVAKNFLTYCGASYDELSLENFPERPYPKLSFSHLSEVATLDDEGKTILLDQAEDNNWPVFILRRAVRRYALAQQSEEIKKGLDDLNEDIKIFNDPFVKMDLERKIVWMHRSYKDWDVRFV